MITLTRAEIARLFADNEALRAAVEKHNAAMDAECDAIAGHRTICGDDADAVCRWPSDDRDDWCSDCPRRHRIELP